MIKMNHLSMPPEKLYLRFQVMPVTNYSFSCLSPLCKHLDLNPIYDFLCSTPKIRLQNIWNWIVKHWNRVHQAMSVEKSFLKSDYYKYKYHYIHQEMDHIQLDEYLQLFIEKDAFKALFVIRCLLKYVFP
jgi:hypothetical protein